ncbi:N-(5'-phosphoribosyl)anthranilate isomerase [Leptolyngbya valderiana BDU 20041]|nr:phosphoribosylanthranilate isomerase [Geitlerinema sp. CS-897]OAB57265.1 N-(5'-phosphoribosyl)anthranilate isomerase [Leptolyngbya valderiana BDU 20041]PPT09268.1 Phosphoribosylanthranilate isomerase [Geitlerinema sp. FC II]
MRVKICGITRPKQGSAIVELGATALGFICVSASPRYVPISRIVEICRTLPVWRAGEPGSQGAREIDRIGVFAKTSVDEICRVVEATPLTGVQLHSDESPEYCQHVRSRLPHVELIKAFRVRKASDLDRLSDYCDIVDAVLLDAYDPQHLGGTGKTLNWESLQTFQFPCPWFLAGGLNPDNVNLALSQLTPDGIDLSSGVERSPGDKDIEKVKRLFETLRKQSPVANHQSPVKR